MSEELKRLIFGAYGILTMAEYTDYVAGLLPHEFNLLRQNYNAAPIHVPHGLQLAVLNRAILETYERQIAAYDRYIARINRMLIA